MATATAASAGAAAHASDYGIDGFDREALDPKVVAKHKKALSRELMTAALGRGIEAVRINALRALKAHGELGEAEVMSVGVMLRDSSAVVRVEAAKTLSAAADLGMAVRALATATRPDRNDLQAAIAEAISGLGVKALPYLIEGLVADPDTAREQIVPHLGRIGEKATNDIAQLLGHEDERARANAISALMHLGPEQLVKRGERVKAMINDPSSIVAEVARDAANALYWYDRPLYKTPAELTVEGLPMRNLTDAEVKKAAKSELTSLHYYAYDGRKTARLNAWRAIEARGKLDDYTTALALVALKDEEAEVRAQACRVVTMCADDRLQQTVKGLVTCALDKDVTVRDAAWSAFERLKKRSLPVLMEELGEREHLRARVIVDAVAEHGANATKALYATLKHIGPIERLNALHALVEIGGKTLEGAHKELCTMLVEPFDAARAIVVRALGHLPSLTKKDAAVVDSIEYMLEYDVSLAVRVEADLALRRIHGAK